MYKWCFVPDCKNTTCTAPNKVFVTVPKDEKRRNQWFNAARRAKPNSKSTFYCCEDHLKLEEDAENFTYYKFMGGPIKLKKTVLPRIFDCQSDRKRASTSATQSTFRKRQRITVINEALESVSGLSKTEETTENAPLCLETTENVLKENIKDIQHKDRGIPVRPSYRSKAVPCKIAPRTSDITASPFKLPSVQNVETSPFQGKLIKWPDTSNLVETESILIENSDNNQPQNVSVDNDFNYNSSSINSDVNYSSDEKEFKRHEILTNSLKVTLSLVCMDPKRYLGIMDTWLPVIIKIIEQKCNISKEQMYLTLMKIKLNDSFARLGDLFSISECNASKIFHKTVKVLAQCLQTLIFWPSKEIIKKLMPIPFRARYSNVQSIIDCLEFEIEKPTKPLMQSLTWSEYKKCNTLKYLVSSTPDGFINFVSKGCGGRTTDDLLLQECGYLDQIPPCCAIMTDREFKHINDDIKKKGCTLIKTPSVSSTAKSTREEVLQTERIASLRIHIEQVIRRIHEFQYLKSHAVINHNLINETDDVIIIAAALINLQNPIIRC